MRVPLFDPKAQNEPLRAQIEQAWMAVADSGRFILGETVEAFEQEFARVLGAQFAVGVSSGTDALLVSLMALGVRPGDEVITSPFSFFASAGVVARLGAVPVFCDIDPKTFTISPERAYDYIDDGVLGRRRKIESVKSRTKVKVFMPVHLFGQCAEMKPILDLAEEFSLMVVEDVCQALMAKFGTQMAGTLGDAGCFSFYPTKILGAFGDAGCVVTNDESLAQSIRILRNHGEIPGQQYEYSEIGGNFRLDALQAAALKIKLASVTRWVQQRTEQAAAYNSLFESSGLLDDVILPVVGKGRTHVFNYYVIRVDQRNELRAALKEKGVDTGIYYPVPLHLQS